MCMETSPARVTHRDIPDWGIWGELGFCLDMQAVDSQKYKQLEAEEATGKSSLNVFLENAAVSEQRRAPVTQLKSERDFIFAFQKCVKA